MLKLLFVILIIFVLILIIRKVYKPFKEKMFEHMDYEHFVEKFKKYKHIREKLVSNEKVVKEDIIKFVEDPVTRTPIYNLLKEFNQLEIFPEKYLSFEMDAEAYFVSWLAMPSVLGNTPEKIELSKTLKLERSGKQETFYIFKFSDRLKKNGEWLIGVIGPFTDESILYRSNKAIYCDFSLFSSTTPKECVDNLIEAYL